jgi:hypothetical protein
LPGRWKITIIAGGGHAWIRFENTETGEVHTAGRYKFGYGDRYDEDGNMIEPPVAVPGVQWDKDLKKEDGYKSGLWKSRSTQKEDPPVYKGENPFGYADTTNNCATYAAEAWEYYTGEHVPLPWPHHPTALEGFLENRDYPPPRGKRPPTDRYDPAPWGSGPKY